MTSALLDLIAKIFPILRYHLKRGDAYDEEFFQEKIRRPGSYFDETCELRLCTFMNKSGEVSHSKRSRILGLRQSQLYSYTIQQENNEIVGLIEEDSMKSNVIEEDKDQENVIHHAGLDNEASYANESAIFIDMEGYIETSVD